MYKLGTHDQWDAEQESLDGTAVLYESWWHRKAETAKQVIRWSLERGHKNKMITTTFYGYLLLNNLSWLYILRWTVPKSSLDPYSFSFYLFYEVLKEMTLGILKNVKWLALDSEAHWIKTKGLLPQHVKDVVLVSLAWVISHKNLQHSYLSFSVHKLSFCT